MPSIGYQILYFNAAPALWPKLIYTFSPQAKGQMKRANQTLQDRLVKYIGLVGIFSLPPSPLMQIHEDNLRAYLPKATGEKQDISIL